MRNTDTLFPVAVVRACAMNYMCDTNPCWPVVASVWREILGWLGPYLSLIIFRMQTVLWIQIRSDPHLFLGSGPALWLRIRIQMPIAQAELSIMYSYLIFIHYLITNIVLNLVVQSH